MIRNDPHRPSAVSPQDYEFVEFEHVKDSCPEITLANRQIIRAHMERTGGTYSHHQHGGNCHICGVAAIYTCLFWHKPTNTYIRTGEDCAMKLDSSVDGREFRKKVQHALERKAGKDKAQAILERHGMSAAWAIYVDEDHVQRYEEQIIFDMVRKLVKYGSLSERQFSYMATLLSKIERRPELDAQRKAEAETAKPVPITDERIDIEGEVLAVKSSDFGRKVMVKAKDGWRIWGTRPGSADVAKGDRVAFRASVTPSKDDPKFGFFSRPTNWRAVDAPSPQGEAPSSAESTPATTDTAAPPSAQGESLSTGAANRFYYMGRNDGWNGTKHRAVGHVAAQSHYDRGYDSAKAEQWLDADTSWDRD